MWVIVFVLKPNFQNMSFDSIIVFLYPRHVICFLFKDTPIILHLLLTWRQNLIYMLTIAISTPLPDFLLYFLSF